MPQEISIVPEISRKLCEIHTRINGIFLAKSVLMLFTLKKDAGP